MVNILKIDMKNNYFEHEITGKKQQNYQNNDSLSLIANLPDGTCLRIKNSCIKTLFNGQQVFDYDDETHYIIDDGYQNVLIRCGYIILNDYDCIKIDDRKIGIQVRKSISDDAASSLGTILDEYYVNDNTISNFNIKNDSIEASFDTSGYHYTICIDTVNRIVNKNQQRKINGLVYYPFNKDMDKYGTMYLSIFCQKIAGQEEEEERARIEENFSRYHFAEEFINDLLNMMNQLNNLDKEYHFFRFIIKRRINYYKEM